LQAVKAYNVLAFQSEPAMDKFGNLLRSKGAAVAVWVLVMYITAFLWNVMDDDSWFAFPTYVLSILIWISSFMYVVGFFLEWTGSGIRLKPQPDGATTTSKLD
jgi:hypothetical protein